MYTRHSTMCTWFIFNKVLKSSLFSSHSYFQTGILTCWYIHVGNASNKVPYMSSLLLVNMLRRKSRITYSTKRNDLRRKKNSTAQSLTKRLATKNDEFVQVIHSLFTNVQIIYQSLCESILRPIRFFYSLRHGDRQSI